MYPLHGCPVLVLRFSRTEPALNEAEGAGSLTLNPQPWRHLDPLSLQRRRLRPEFPPSAKSKSPGRKERDNDGATPKLEWEERAGQPPTAVRIKRGTAAPQRLEVIPARARSAQNVAAPNYFHNTAVTSDLAPTIKSRDHGRGRDGRVNPHRRASKSFVPKIL